MRLDQWPGTGVLREDQVQPADHKLRVLVVLQFGSNFLKLFFFFSCGRLLGSSGRVACSLLCSFSVRPAVICTGRPRQSAISKIEVTQSTHVSVVPHLAQGPFHQRVRSEILVEFDLREVELLVVSRLLVIPRAVEHLVV